MKKIRIDLLSVNPSSPVAILIECVSFRVLPDYVEVYPADEPGTVRYFYGWTKVEAF